VIPSRSDYGSIKSAVKAISEDKRLELQLIVSGAALVEKYGNTIEYIKKDGFKIDAALDILIQGDSPMVMAKTTGLATIEMATTLDRLKPDIVLSVGDRYETMATAIASAYMNIPLAQTMCGEISGTIDENTRHAITKLAHIHFPASEDARQRVIKMGEQPEHVFLVGCPRIDSALNDKCDLTTLYSEYKGIGNEIDINKPFLLVSQHPVTTEWEQARSQIEQTLQALNGLKMPTIMLWSNPDAGSDAIAKGIRTFREHNQTNTWLHMFNNLPPEVYFALMDKCACLIGNSSSAIREGAVIGVPAVNIGTRQLNRKHGDNVIDVIHYAPMIQEAIQSQVKHGKYKANYMYGDGRAGFRIAEILATCKPNINKRMTY
jgi:UDP-hydrolysing UDP-N-acetyl-D-glucosamine 2-epimerase